MRLFQEWEATCRKADHDQVEIQKKAGFNKKGFIYIAIRIRWWYFNRQQAESGSTPGD